VRAQNLAEVAQRAGSGVEILLSRYGKRLYDW
jgi:hypothetical protein